ncbi:hypothetical protein J6590_019743 [Homalodisca vitripennis]|nr:hypothetical protein J6590_019743 [Homalodisca vitripennis]
MPSYRQRRDPPPPNRPVLPRRGPLHHRTPVEGGQPRYKVSQMSPSCSQRRAGAETHTKVNHCYYNITHTISVVTWMAYFHRAAAAATGTITTKEHGYWYNNNRGTPVMA